MSLEARPTVLWREGMFLCPQHLQTFSREVTERVHAAESIGTPGNWGILSLNIDREALRRDLFRLESADVVFRDGALAAFPSNATVAQREFGDHFTGQTLAVYLGIPAIRPGAAALAQGRGDEGARYVAQQGTVFDENVAASERDVDFKVMQGRLFFGDEDQSGFECVHLAQLVRKGKTEPYSALSDTFIPTVLAIGGSEVLMAELSEVADQLLSQSRDLAGRIPQTTMLSSVEKGADVAAFVKLQAVNQCAPGLDQIRRLPEIHPFQAYLQLIGGIGSLAIFSDERTLPEYGSYHHGDLNKSFRSALQTIRQLIPKEVSVPYEKEDFREDPNQPGLLICDVPADWAEKERAYFIGVKASATAEDVISKAPDALKLTSAANFEDVLVGVMNGIPIESVRAAPLAFPKEGLHFFRILTEGTARDSWLTVLDSGRALLLRTPPADQDWEFGLYVEMRS